MRLSQLGLAALNFEFFDIRHCVCLIKSAKYEMIGAVGYGGLTILECKDWG